MPREHFVSRVASSERIAADASPWGLAWYLRETTCHAIYACVLSILHHDPIVPVSVCDMLFCLSLAVRSLSCSVRVRSRSSSVTSPLTFPIFYRALFHLPCHNRLHVHVHQFNSLLSNSFSTGLNFHLSLTFVNYSLCTHYVVSGLR
jgi:hypothetical protein